MTALPDPTDIQVATGWPEVEAYRAAVRTLRQAQLEKNRSHRYRDSIYRVAKRNTPAQSRVRDRADKAYRDSVTAMVEAELQLRKAEKAALQVAPDALERLHLSAAAYSARLFRERQADLERRGKAA